MRPAIPQAALYTPHGKGYAYSQLHKLAIKQPTGKRAELVAQHGYDCYLESETEFLTNTGWKKYDDVGPSDLLAVVSPASGQLGWETYTERIDKPYSGPVYTVEPAMTRCVVTPNHHMLVSPARRNPATNYSYDYFEDKGDWGLVPFSTLNTGARSWFHTRRRVNLRCDEYSVVTDEYLALAGLYVSEGSLGFRDGRVKQARITQTERGKEDFFRSADRFAPAFGLRKYGYAKETVWTIPRLVAERLLLDFGRGSGKKRLPVWAFQLSARQADIFWSHACLGDGTQAPNGEVYYTSSPQLAADMQAMLTCAGILCSVRGPYKYEFAENAFGNCDMFQVYRPNDQYAFSCVDFKSRVHRPGDGKDTWPIKERQVCNARIVCFQVPSGTLITRSQGRVALHGNTKFAYHVVRLLGEVEQILLEGDIDLQRDNERLKAIRRGEWTEERLRQWASDKEADLERAYAASKLPAVPDEAAIRTLLLNCLEEHYGNLSDCVVQPDRAVAALRAVQAEIDKVKDLL